MNAQVNEAADRVAHAAAELMTSLSGLANAARDASDFSVAYWEVIDPAVDLRKSILHILAVMTGRDRDEQHAKTIHFAAMADKQEGSDKLYGRPADCSPTASVSIL